MKRLHNWLQDRENFHRTLFWIWLGPGFVACLYFRESLLWVGLMSWYTIVWQHGGSRDTAHAAKEAVKEVNSEEPSD